MTHNLRTVFQASHTVRGDSSYAGSMTRILWRGHQGWCMQSLVAVARPMLEGLEGLGN